MDVSPYQKLQGHITSSSPLGEINFGVPENLLRTKPFPSA